MSGGKIGKTGIIGKISMRKIKFRVWNIKDGYWDNPAILEVFSCDGLFRPLYDPVDNYIIQQYTELKDKNNKEIYEGDIVKTSLSHMFRSNIYEVKYYQNRFTPDDICDKEDVAVIGNIFENKELLA